MSKYSQDKFIPKHPEKLLGKKEIFYRSSWELLMMNFLDNHPSVIQWASESIRIPYTNPLTGQRTQYVPDFFVLSQDRNGKRQAEMVEVKPKNEALMEHARSQRDKAFLAINTAKFAAAMVFCKKNNIKFTVITEDQLFRQKGKNK
jgi:hypothetical protein